VKVQKIIQLATCEDNLIGYIDKVQIYKNRIFILDIFTSKGIFVFDIEGSYIGQLGHHGRGPGEYITPISFTIDEKNDEVLIFDNALRKVLYYRISNLSLIKEIPIDFYFTNSLWMDNTDLAYFIPGSLAYDFKGQVRITDSQFETINEFAPKELYTRYGYGFEYIYKVDGRNYFYRPNEYIIYEFDEYSFAPVFNIEFFADIPPVDYSYEQEEHLSFSTRLEASNYVNRYSIVESTETISVYFKIRDMAYMGIYDKYNAKATTFKMEDIYVDAGQLKRPLTTCDDYFVSELAAINDDDNPRLIIYEF
jgi:hypothetical protein